MGQLLCLIQQLICWINRLQQTAGLGGSRIQNLCRVGPFQRCLQPHDARQKPGRTGLRNNAQLAKHKTDSRFLRCKAKVHGQRHGRADTHRGAVDRRNDWLGAVIDGQGHATAGVADTGNHLGILQPVAHVLQVRLQGLIEAEDIALDGKVHAGAKRLSAARDDDSANLVIKAGSLEGVLEFVRHLHGESVEVLWPVQGQNQDAFFSLPIQRLVIHKLRVFPLF